MVLQGHVLNHVSLQSSKTESAIVVDGTEARMGRM